MALNEHTNYINKTYSGGLNSYTDKQQKQL